MRRLYRMILLILQIAILAYLALCAIVYFRQEDFLFFPEHRRESDLLRIARQVGFQPWRNAAGKLIGWESADGNDAKRILLFHGNGGYALHRAPFLARTRQNMRSNDWRIYILEYPGYGARAGKTSEFALNAAGLDALDTLVARGSEKVVLLGESLGSAVACAIAGRAPEQIAGVVLITPFNRLADVAQAHYPWLPCKLLLRQRFDAQRHLARYSGPVAILAGESDATIPAEFARRLHDSYGGPKGWWLAAGAEHNDFESLTANWDSVLTWIEASSGS